jgi:hypothetical protein
LRRRLPPEHLKRLTQLEVHLTISRYSEIWHGFQGLRRV